MKKDHSHTDVDEPEIRILLWAPFGAGTHYWGPGTSAYRLIQKAPESLSFDLVHGFPPQVPTDVFDNEYCLGDLRDINPWKLARFLMNGKKWLKQNAQNFDYFYGLGLFHQTVLPAYWAENFGLPATVKTTGLGGGLGRQNTLSKILGLAKKRKKMLGQISHIVALSAEIEEEMKAHGFNYPRLVRIPNGVDTERFQPVESSEARTALRTELGLPDRFTLLFVGGMSSRKQPMLVLRILAELKSKGQTNIQAVFVGPEREEGLLRSFKEEMKRLDLSEDVIHIDHTEEVERYYQASDCYLLLSKNEGMSNALLEALACGLPSIVTPASGSRDLIGDDEAGIIVESHEIDKAVDYVMNLMQDESKVAQVSRQARARILDTFSYASVWDAYLKECFSASS